MVALGGVLLGRTTMAREIESGLLFLSGDTGLSHTIDRWLPASDYAEVEGIAELPENRETEITCFTMPATDRDRHAKAH